MEIEQYKLKLQEEFEEVTKELETVGRLTNAQTGDWEAKETEMDEATPMQDPNESADAQEEYGINRGINDELEVRYREIRAALKRIDEGIFGICEECGEEIEPDRLEANPAARTCKAHME